MCGRKTDGARYIEEQMELSASNSTAQCHPIRRFSGIQLFDARMTRWLHASTFSCRCVDHIIYIRLRIDINTYNSVYVNQPPEECDISVPWQWIWMNFVHLILVTAATIVLWCPFRLLWSPRRNSMGLNVTLGKHMQSCKRSVYIYIYTIYTYSNTG